MERDCLILLFFGLDCQDNTRGATSVRSISFHRTLRPDRSIDRWGRPRSLAPHSRDALMPAPDALELRKETGEILESPFSKSSKVNKRRVTSRLFSETETRELPRELYDARVGSPQLSQPNPPTTTTQPQHHPSIPRPAYLPHPLIGPLHPHAACRPRQPQPIRALSADRRHAWQPHPFWRLSLSRSWVVIERRLMAGWKQQARYPSSSSARFQRLSR